MAHHLLLFLLATTAILITVSADNRLKILPDTTLLTKQVGSNVGLACKADVEDPNLIGNMEWFDPNGRKIENTYKNLPVYVQRMTSEPGLILTFNGLSEQQAGTYICAASYASSERLAANITIKTMVDITFADAPLDQYAKLGTDYKIRCEVRGNPQPSVDWIRNDVSLTSNERYIIDSSGLLIKNVRESDDGVYTCSALVLETGNIQYRNINLEVLVPPQIQPMEEVSVIEGRTASIQCSATGKPPPSYKWIKESRNEDLSKTDRFSVKETSGLLVINRVEYGDNGYYKCEAKNDADIAEQRVKVNVLVSPKIDKLQRQLNITAAVGTEATIACLAQGRPVPQVTFRKLSTKEDFKVGVNNDRYFLLQNYNEEEGYNNATLTFYKLNRTDDGLYHCIATNLADEAYQIGHVTVQFPPTFEKTKDLPPVYTWGERPGNLTCIPEAIPNATITWKFQDREIDNNTNPAVFQIVGRAQQSNLIVRPGDQRQYFTRYECIARNFLGEAKLHIELQKAEVPRQVQQVTIQSVTATTVKFGIVPPQNLRGLPLRSFVVQYRNIKKSFWSHNHTWAVDAPYILENLQPEAEYIFRFAATNDVGRGAWNNMVHQLMPRRSVPAEPKILTPNYVPTTDDNDVPRSETVAVSPYSDRYELRWNVPNDSGDPIDSYIIRYCETEKVNGEWRDLGTCSEPITQSFQHTTYMMANLKPDTTYKVELRAHNAIGHSTPAEVRIRTARGIDLHVHEEVTTISSGAIIGFVIVAILLILVIVDIICFCVARAGILAMICNRAKSQDDEDPKMGSYKAAPAHPNTLNLPMPVKLAPSPLDEKEPLRSETHVEFDGQQVYAKKGEIVGKHSAV